MGKRPFLSLDAARAVAAGELLHLGDGDAVVVALDGVLQRGSRHRELTASWVDLPFSRA